MYSLLLNDFNVHFTHPSLSSVHPHSLDSLQEGLAVGDLIRNAREDAFQVGTLAVELLKCVFRPGDTVVAGCWDVREGRVKGDGDG